MQVKLIRSYFYGFIWFLALVGSQFYFFPSGLPQPAHILLAVVILLTLIYVPFSVLYKKQIKPYKYAALFLGYSSVVNIVWSIIEGDVEFLMASIYWFFGFLLSFSIGVYLRDKNSIRYFQYAMFTGILLLVFFLALGLGRDVYFPRYSAFFNDPNQLAFWVLCSFSIFFMLSSENSSKRLILFLGFLSTVLIAFSMSRSALLGLVFIFVGMYLRLQPNFGMNNSGRIIFFVFSIVFSIVLTVFVFVFVEVSDFNLDFFKRFTSISFNEQADIRGYYRIIQYPEYLFFGSGQGLNIRFNTLFEIHSSWVALFFYYGFFGFVLFVLFLFNIFYKLDASQKFVFMGPLFYGFFTYGLRTPIFWVFIASAIYLANNNRIRYN